MIVINIKGMPISGCETSDGVTKGPVRINQLDPSLPIGISKRIQNLSISAIEGGPRY
jgi:hypothetical protein